MILKNNMYMVCPEVTQRLTLKRWLIIVQQDCRHQSIPDWSEVVFNNFETIQQSLHKQLNLSLSLSAINF
jgi:hypothetical protein